MLYAGLDIHKEKSHAVVMTEKGEVIKESDDVKTDEKKIKRFFEDVEEEFEVAMEATGNYEFFYETLEEMANEVHLANPYKTRLIAEEEVKTDKVDANTLADLLRGNLLPCSYIPGKEIRDLRRIGRKRVKLGQQRTNLKNQIMAELRRQNIEYSNRSLFSEKGKRFLKNLSNILIDSCLSIYEKMDEEVERVEDKLTKRGLKHKEVRLLNTIPGVGPYSATLIFAEIADIDRFSSEEKLFSYAGLVPKVHQSGNSTRLGKIKQKCNQKLRWILLQDIQNHYQYCPNSNISSYYEKIKRKKNKNAAKIAGARKLLQAIYWMLKNHDKFRAKG